MMWRHKQAQPKEATRAERGIPWDEPLPISEYTGKRSSHRPLLNLDDRRIPTSLGSDVAGDAVQGRLHASIVLFSPSDDIGPSLPPLGKLACYYTAREYVAKREYVRRAVEAGITYSERYATPIAELAEELGLPDNPPRVGVDERLIGTEYR